MRLCGYLCSRTLSPRSFTVRFRHGQRPGGDEGNRTLDPLLAGQVLSQLSYTPILGIQLTFQSLKIEQQLVSTTTYLCLRLSSRLPFLLYLEIRYVRENVSVSP